MEVKTIEDHASEKVGHAQLSGSKQVKSIDSFWAGA